ncbi:MAG: protein kinase, partial [Candidatus Xenobia bacterium]
HSVTMGGLGYTAPEQLLDARRADWRADLFSVGMIVLEILGGANPLRMMQPVEAARAISQGRIPPTPRPIPEPIDTWARRMTAALPQNRPPDAHTARMELRRARQNAGPLPVPVDVESSAAWASISAALRRARRLAAENDRALLLVGPPGASRECLLGMAIGYAQEIGMTVLHTDSFPELSRAVGCSEDAEKVIGVLCNIADDNPTLVVFDVLAVADANQARLFDMVARARSPLVMLACSETPPQTRATLLQVSG